MAPIEESIGTKRRFPNRLLRARLAPEFPNQMLAPQQLRDVVRFGVFEADLRAAELRKNGVKVKIQDLPFRTLKLLLSHPNEVLTRDQFRRALWPEGVFVDFDHGISSAINRLRDALGDSADNPIFIETVERRGYRWIAPTHTPGPPPPPELVVVTPAQKPGHVPAPRRWAWTLIFPVAALVVAAWGFRPAFRPANAGSRKASNTAPVGSTMQDSSEAAQFYLKGRFYWQKRNAEGLNKAVDYFTQAIVRDPNYAPAYVGLADCYNLMREYTLMPASEAYPRALASAKKAVALDDQSSEAHASLAFVLFYGSWDAKDADREFRRALELNPNNAVAHHWYATYLSTVGRRAESVTEIERAQTLDPSSKSILADRGDLLYFAGRRDEAMTLLKQLETAEPDFVSPHRYLKLAYFIEADYPNYIREARKEAGLLQDHPGIELADAAEKGFGTGGAQGMLRSMLTLQKKLYERGSTSSFALAQIYAESGDKQEALQYLKLAYEKHEESVVGFEQDPLLNSLHNEPAYKELEARLGIPSHN